MELESKVKQVLGDVLSLGKRADSLRADSPLLGAIPEMDSMAVVHVLAALEDNFGISIQDDEIDGDTFATLGSLVRFVQEKSAA